MTLRFEAIPSAGRALLAGPLSMLHRACFPEDPWGLPAMTDILRMPGCYGEIAWGAAQPIGFALALAMGEECEILSLGVVPQWRRSGVAAALLDATCGEAVRRGARAVLLEVAADNTGARVLYAGRGFVAVGRRPDYYRQARGATDALVLRLGLCAGHCST